VTGPADGAVIGAQVTFAWTSFAGASRYNVTLSTSANGSSVTWSNETAQTSLSYAPGPEMVPGTTYYWSVRALTPGGWGPFAPWRSISRPNAGGMLATPVLNTPTSGAQVALPEKFSWLDVSGATSYLVQTSASSAFSSILWSTQTGGSAVQPPTSAGPSVGAPYYWRV
jgi:hypothetical protein